MGSCYILPQMSTLPAAPYDIREVANYLLDYADVRKLSLTQISLLDILSFCQYWYLMSHRAPLIKNIKNKYQDNDPEVRELREAFKHHGENAITSRADRFDINSGEMNRVVPNLSVEDKVFVEKIFESYMCFGSGALRDLTHFP